MRFKTLKNIINSVVEHDFFGMASEMGFMLCIGICPFILFLTALFGYIGKQYFMQPIFIFMQSIMPNDVLNVVNTVLNDHDHNNSIPILYQSINTPCNHSKYTVLLIERVLLLFPTVYNNRK